MRLGHLTLFSLLLVGSIQAQQLNDKVLVVHNTEVPESVQVADYYVLRRGIPAANRCAITSSVTTKLTWTDYDTKVRQPIRTCLNSVGRNNILYIVFSYQTPYKVQAGSLAYSLDQYVADIWDIYSVWNANPWPVLLQPYHADAQTEGGYYPPFTQFADYRAQGTSMPIYSVWRLDAANAAIAKGLVDKAIQAETSGLAGQACFDLRKNETYDNGYGSGEWDLARAADLTRLAGFAVTEDTQDEEFGTAPAPLRCDNAALYAGWYTYNSYNDAFTWAPGAFGFHLDSGSAMDPRGGSNWAANALLKGITVTSGAVAEPYLTGLAHPDVVFRSLLQGANAGDAVLRGTQWLKWMVLNFGDPLYRPFPGGRAPFNAVFGEAALTLAPRTVAGPGTINGTVQLKSPAPAGGTVVTLSSNRPTTASVPPSVTVAAGQRTASFSISITPVTDDADTKITANTGSETLTNSIVVVPLLGTLSFTPNYISAGQPVTGFLQMQGLAPAGGASVQLQSSHPALVAVPATVSVGGWQNAMVFQANTFLTTVKTTVTITATYAGAAATAKITVEPAIASVSVTPSAAATGATRTLKVNLSDAAGAGTSLALSSSAPAVVSVPASVPVPPGATSVSVTLPASMTAGSSVISVAYLGDVRTIATTTDGVAVASISINTSIVGGNVANGTVTLNGVSASSTVVPLVSSSPSALPPASVTIPAGSTTATFPILTLAVADPITITLTATGKTDTMVINPPALSSVTLSPVSVAAGSGGTGTITLSGIAPTGGSLVTLSTLNPAAQVPAAVLVLAGAKTATFFYTTSAVSSATVGTVSGVFRGVTKSGNLTVQPAALTSMALSTPAIEGGMSLTGTVQLNGIAAASGAVISLSCGNAGVSVPATVVVPANASSATFSITTSAVNAITNIKIVGTHGVKTANVTITVVP